MRIDTEDLNEPLMTTCIIMSLPITDLVLMCLMQVAFTKGLKAQGNVEDWLCKLEEAMFSSLRHLSKAAIADYQLKSREEWVVAGHPSQVIIKIYIEGTSALLIF